jgi:outer membrane receptor protein involved in Fe transport
MLGSKALLQCASTVALITGVFVGGPALAQTAQGQVDEIIVTVQKRQQNLQDVPVVVTALGADLLRDNGVNDVKDLQLLVPGLTITNTTSETVLTARLRGIGTVGDNPGLESSVGLVIDGVYRPRNGVGIGDLGETQQIEVVKGPQSTLFGKSTSAGVINIVTAAPSFDFASGWEATVGNYDARGGSAWITGPFGDKAAGRLFVARRKRDGYLDVVTGQGPRTLAEDTDQDFWTVRGQLLVRDDKVSVRLIADYTERDENCCATVQTVRGTSPVSRANLLEAVRPGAIAASPDPYARVAYSNRDTASDVQDLGVSAQLDVDLGRASLTSITAVRRWASQKGQDSDFSTADIWYRPVRGYTDLFESYSQEVRLAGDTGRLNWLVGAFYAQEDYTGRSPLVYGTDYYAYWAGRVLGNAPGLIGALPTNTFMPGAGQNDSFDQDNTTWAVFTNNSFAITDAWDLTVGLRYSSDDKTLTSDFKTTGASCARGRAAFPTLAGAVGGAQAGAIVTGLCLPWENEALDARSGVQTRQDKKWSGTVKTSYRWNDVMTYASYARGFKAGGFNFDRPNTSLSFATGAAVLTIAPGTGFAAETTDAYELGAKSEWFGKRLALNVAAFHQTYKNFQLNTFLGTQFIVESIPKVVSKGVDLDFRWRLPIEGLDFQGGVTWAQTDIGVFTAADLAQPANFAGLARLPGSRLSFAPLWSGSLATTYETPLGDGGLKARFNLSGKFTTGYNTGSDLAPQKYQKGYTVVNGRVGVGNDTWMIEAWAANLFDTNYKQVAINSPLQGTEGDAVAIRTYNAFLAPPRTFGLTLRVTY